MADPEKAYAPPVVTPGAAATAPPPPPPPPPATAADRAAAWKARRPLILRVLAVLGAQFLTALAVGLALALTPAAQAYVRSRSWPVAASAFAAVLSWIALAVSQAKAHGGSPAWARARPPLLAAFSAALALFLGTLAARLPGSAALTAAVGVGVLVAAALLAAAVGLNLTRAGAVATGLVWAASLTAGATIWVARTHGDRWWVTLLAGLATVGVAIYLALDVQALAGGGPLAGGGRWGWRGGGLARPTHVAVDDWVGGATALATDLGLGFVAVAALASGGRL